MLCSGKVTGKYSEDFEAYQSLLEYQLAEEDDEDDDISDNEELEANECETGGQVDTDDAGSSDVSEEKEERLTLTIDDVKVRLS